MTKHFKLGFSVRGKLESINQLEFASPNVWLIPSKKFCMTTFEVA